MSETRRIRLGVAYDGTEFSGFQSLLQRRTVQGTLQSALSAHCKEPIHVYGAGRTDAGVHASGQVVHFDTTSRTPADRYPEALRKRLPGDLTIWSSEEVLPEFHARFSARSRRYRYAIAPGNRSPLVARFAWTPGAWDRKDATPNLEIMRAEAARLAGERDFSPFALVGDEKHTVRRIHRVRVEAEQGAIFVQVEANAFLRGMMRWIVAALWSRATGQLSEAEFSAMLDGHSRPERLVPAPAQGLCLVKVMYESPALECAGQGE